MLLNLDAGERADEPEALWRLFDILAIACGGHAGDDVSMARVIRTCIDAHVSIGAHPSYPDREGFGRRSIAIAPHELTDAVSAQCAALRAIAAARDARVDYVKPHGALYHDVARDGALAEAFLEGALAALGNDVALIGPPTGALARGAARRDLAYLREGFADRRLRPDGSLVPRSEPGALIADPLEAVKQARAIAPTVDTICVHADTPSALAIARALRDSIEA